MSIPHEYINPGAALMASVPTVRMTAIPHAEEERYRATRTDSTPDAAQGGTE